MNEGVIECASVERLVIEQANVANTTKEANGGQIKRKMLIVKSLNDCFMIGIRSQMRLIFCNEWS